MTKQQLLVKKIATPFSLVSKITWKYVTRTPRCIFLVLHGHLLCWCVCDIAIAQSHITIAIWWPLGVAVVSVTCMQVRWVSDTWKYTQWNIVLFESSDKSLYWTNLLAHSIQMGSTIKFSYWFWTMSQWYLHFTSQSFTYLSKLPAHMANDCHGPWWPPDGYSNIANVLFNSTLLISEPASVLHFQNEFYANQTKKARQKDMGWRTSNLLQNYRPCIPRLLAAILCKWSCGWHCDLTQIVLHNYRCWQG